jgi:TrpR-related protein YerC/YecD
MKPNKQATERQQIAAENALCSALVSLNSTAECRDFLRDLCTPAELQALIDRWQVVELLENGLTYRQINDLTSISVTTIGRVARFLADGHGGYRTAIDRTATKQTSTSH